MTGIEFLIVLTIVSIILIIGLFIFQTRNYMTLKSYHEYWEPIYKNRREHFDEYLKYALNHREEGDTLERVALLAVSMRCDIDRNAGIDITYSYIDSLKEVYLHELRCAGIE